MRNTASSAAAESGRIPAGRAGAASEVSVSGGSGRATPGGGARAPPLPSLRPGAAQRSRRLLDTPLQVGDLARMVRSDRLHLLGNPRLGGGALPIRGPFESFHLGNAPA